MTPMGPNTPPPCPKYTWRPHIRRRRPLCPKGGVRTHTIGALRHIWSPLDLQHGPRGSKIEKTSSTSLNTYTGMKHICGDQVKRIYGQSRPKNPQIKPSAVSQAQKQTKMPRGTHYGALAATKWTNMSLTSKDLFFFFR